MWAALGAPRLEKLEAAAGEKGAAAQALVARLKSITVPADISRQVLLNSLHGYYYPFVTAHFPGLKQRAEAQVVSSLSCSIVAFQWDMSLIGALQKTSTGDGNSASCAKISKKEICSRSTLTWEP